MIHPHSELRHVSPAIGDGVFATRFIPKGTVTWVFDDLDQVIPSGAEASLPPLLRGMVEKYSYQNGRGHRILCWDHSRFVNHSCHPTSLAPGFDFEIAIRDIEPGEQITDDYASLNLETEFPCACGTPQCRGSVGPGDFEKYSDRWDILVSDAFPLIHLVEQPLWDLVREQTDVRKVLAGDAPIPSCRVHRTGVPLGIR